MQQPQKRSSGRAGRKRGLKVVRVRKATMLSRVPDVERKKAFAQFQEAKATAIADANALKRHPALVCSVCGRRIVGVPAIPAVPAVPAVHDDAGNLVAAAVPAVAAVPEVLGHPLCPRAHGMLTAKHVVVPPKSTNVKPAPVVHEVVPAPEGPSVTDAA